MRRGWGSVAIAERLNITRKTVSKYMAEDGFQERPKEHKAAQSSKLDPFKPLIQEWLEEDRKNRYKQWHTAMRIHKRLTAECKGYDASYPIVQCYVKSLRKHRYQEGTLELDWQPGEAQVDFGEAEFYDASGEKRMHKFLCVSFPYSNAGYVQLFGGETAECVAHGLQDIFHRIGGVPTRLIFDNASGVGRRVSENVRIAEVFLRFKAHYGYELTFCNPYVGHEQRNVENKVGYMRRNLFVPLPTVTDVQAFNRELLDRCEADWQRKHYKKGVPMNLLFEDDRKAFLYLPKMPFAAYRYTRVKTDGYGKFLVDGKHFYSSAPEWAGKELAVRIGAHTVAPLAPSGEPISVHIRIFGRQRTDSVDVRTTLSRLLQSPGAWRNSLIRKALPERLREEMDGLERAELREALPTVQDRSSRYDFDTALQALEQATELGSLSSSNSVVLAARLAAFEPEETSGVDRGVYDELLQTTGGG
ncbi:IS21 family transposase [Paenibacillus xerothermodurans]|uniref:IS21 family transposase n=1 Tax=Paenibacillus xerothermodurans TaxID=1977292 RepID=A0A2W1NUA6_PAEXE|nr:IS21 family transposase [Paenibacillus xerothermodurans]PZE22243.1 IS21 family transposase [Paenibacillus xerothermodurans]